MALITHSFIFSFVPFLLRAYCTSNALANAKDTQLQNMERLKTQAFRWILPVGKRQGDEIQGAREGFGGLRQAARLLSPFFLGCSD